MTCSQAFWTCAGVPSVLRTCSVQPSRSAACLMMSPSRLQAELPQLMKSIFFPVGIGLPIGTSKLMLVGRVSYLATAAFAAATGSPDTAVPPPPDVAVDEAVAVLPVVEAEEVAVVVA